MDRMTNVNSRLEERLTVLTKEEWDVLYFDYKDNGSEIAYADLYNALKPIAIPVGKSEYFRFKYLELLLADFENEAEYAIVKAIDVYDPAKGSLPALTKQLVKWSISDNLVRPAHSKKGQHAHNSISLDSIVATGLLADESLIVTEEEVYGGVLNSDIERTFVTEVTELITGFKKESTVDDAKVIETVFNLIMDAGESNARAVNKSLAAIFTEISTSALRKKKQRALNRFTAFAQDNGFNSVDLSQF